MFNMVTYRTDVLEDGYQISMFTHDVYLHQCWIFWSGKTSTVQDWQDIQNVFAEKAWGFPYHTIETWDFRGIVDTDSERLLLRE